MKTRLRSHSIFAKLIQETYYHNNSIGIILRLKSLNSTATSVTEKLKAIIARQLYTGTSLKVLAALNVYLRVSFFIIHVHNMKNEKSVKSLV